MRRLFWFTLGAGTGAWATHRLTRFARGWTPQGICLRVLGRYGRLRMYAMDIRAEAQARECELRDALGLTAGMPRDGHRPRTRTADGQIFDKEQR